MSNTVISVPLQHPVFYNFWLFLSTKELEAAVVYFSLSDVLKPFCKQGVGFLRALFSLGARAVSTLLFSSPKIRPSPHRVPYFFKALYKHYLIKYI